MLSVPQTISRAASASSIVQTAGSGSMSMRDATARIFGRGAVAMREEHDRFLGVVDDPVGEVGLIVGNQLDPIDAGNVGRCDDREIVPHGPPGRR